MVDDLFGAPYNIRPDYLTRITSLASIDKALPRTIDRALAAQGKVTSLIVKHYRVFLLFGLLTVCYLAATYMMPMDTAAIRKYHLSVGAATIISLSVALPYVVIWIVAVVGHVKLKDYADGIKESKDGRAFRLISAGIFYLTLWLPLSAVLTVLATYVYRTHANLTPVTVYINNYGNIAITCVAVILIYKGTRSLLALAKTHERAMPEGLAAYAAFAGLYTFLVLQDPARQLPVPSVHVASYYTSDWLTIVSVVMPRLVIWYIGFQAAYNIYVYRMNVKGKIYRQALNSLALGVASVTATIAILRSVQTLTVRLGYWNLILLVILVYALLGMIAVGYIFIARGAQNLQRIEDV